MNGSVRQFWSDPSVFLPYITLRCVGIGKCVPVQAMKACGGVAV